MMPLRLVVTEQAQSEAIAAQNWLAGFAPDAAERFAETLAETLNTLCRETPENVAIGRFGDLTNTDGSPFHRHLMSTAKHRKRRTNSGVWWLVFLLDDSDNDAVIDTLRLVGIVHAASERGSFASP